MTSTTELLSSGLGKAFLEAKERADRVKMFYRKNEIGEDIIVEWNPYKKLDKNPYAAIVAQAYDEMVKNTIPKEGTLIC